MTWEARTLEDPVWDLPRSAIGIKRPCVLLVCSDAHDFKPAIGQADLVPT